MADDNGRDADDAYVIEDTEGSVEEIEREMRETAEEAAEAAAAAAADTAAQPEAASPQDDYKNRYVRAIADFEGAGGGSQSARARSCASSTWKRCIAASRATEYRPRS